MHIVSHALDKSCSSNHLQYPNIHSIGLRARKIFFKSFCRKRSGSAPAPRARADLYRNHHATSSASSRASRSLTVVHRGLPQNRASHRRASSITRAICAGVKGPHGRRVPYDFRVVRHLAQRRANRFLPRIAAFTLAPSGLLEFFPRDHPLRRATSSPASYDRSLTACRPSMRRMLRITSTIGVPSRSINCYLGLSAPMPAFPIPAAEEWQRFGSCLERFRPTLQRR